MTAAGTADDRRALRVQRTRTAVVDALLALQEEGVLAPTAQQVAARAGVALRTVFGHFSDMETLWVEAGRRELQALSAVADEVPADLPLPERVSRFASSRARVLEKLLPVLRAARLREPTSPAMTANRARFVEVADAEAARVFAPELGDRDGDGLRRALDALFVVAGGPAWESLRVDRGLAPHEAEDHLRRQLGALLQTLTSSPEVL